MTSKSKIKLNVPLITQQSGSLDCGLISLLMVLKYYGADYSLTSLQKDLKVDQVGTYTPQMGSFLLKQGYQVEIVTQHPGLFTLKDQQKTQSEILQHLQKLYLQEKKDQNQKVLQYFIDFLTSGGIIKVAIPDSQYIHASLNQNTPLIALMTTHFLTENAPKFNFHFNVITGINSSSIYLNDPLPDQRGGQKQCSHNNFFFALYAATGGDLDNGSLMKVTRK